MANYTKITFANPCDIGNVYYQTGFVQWIYLDAELSKPDFIDETEEDIDEEGNTLLTFQKLSKRYRLTAFVPEYIVNALKTLPMHDAVGLQYTDGTVSMDMKNIKVESEFDDDFNGCMATVAITFESDNVIVKSGCCVNIS